MRMVSGGWDSQDSSGGLCWEDEDEGVLADRLVLKSR